MSRRAARLCAASFAAAALLAGACSSSDDGGSSTSTSGSGGAGGADLTPADSCVRPGDKGNDRGVGEYCSPQGGQCAGFPQAPLCLADVGQDQWMCTRIGCDSADDCGEDAGCLIVEGEGSACVPCRCDDTGLGCPGGAGGGGGAGGAAGGGGAGGAG